MLFFLKNWRPCLLAIATLVWPTSPKAQAVGDEPIPPMLEKSYNGVSDECVRGIETMYRNPNWGIQYYRNYRDSTQKVDPTRVDQSTVVLMQERLKLMETYLRYRRDLFGPDELSAAKVRRLARFISNFAPLLPVGHPLVSPGVDCYDQVLADIYRRQVFEDRLNDTSERDGDEDASRAGSAASEDGMTPPTAPPTVNAPTAGAAPSDQPASSSVSQ